MRRATLIAAALVAAHAAGAPAQTKPAYPDPARQIRIIVDDVTFNGIVVPAGTPREALERLHAEIAAVLNGPELRKRFLERGIELQPSRSPDEFSAYLRSEVEKYAKLAREAGIKAD